jgi:hypothetical protein
MQPEQPKRRGSDSIRRQEESASADILAPARMYAELLRLADLLPKPDPKEKGVKHIEAALPEKIDPLKATPRDISILLGHLRLQIGLLGHKAESALREGDFLRELIRKKEERDE